MIFENSAESQYAGETNVTMISSYINKGPEYRVLPEYNKQRNIIDKPKTIIIMK